MADNIFEVELPAVDLSTPMRVAFQKLNTAKRAGIIVLQGKELVLGNDLINGLHHEVERPMGWLVEHLRQERRLRGKDRYWRSNEIVDYFRPRLETYAATFGAPDVIPSEPLGTLRPINRGRFYSVTQTSPTVGKVIVRTNHPWLGRGLMIGMAICECTQKCGGFDSWNVTHGQPCPTGDGGTIDCR
jgi:hypothetical protein